MAARIERSLFTSLSSPPLSGAGLLRLVKARFVWHKATPPLGSFALARSFLPSFAFLVLFASGAAMAQSAPQQPASIETIGAASVSVTPDTATLRIGVERTDKTTTKAFGAASAAINDVIESMKAQGVAVADISTSNLSLSPVYDQQKTDARGRPQIVGYSAAVEVTVVSRDIAKAGALLDAALKDGANQMNGIVYDVADKKPALDEARREAAKEARRKAELYAAALGLKLGPVLRVYEPAEGSPRPFAADLRMAKAGGESLNVEPGRIEISAEVGTVWAVER
jgi:uncharacterized protein